MAPFAEASLLERVMSETLTKNGKLLIVIIVLQAVMILMLWSSQPAALDTPAYGQRGGGIPDAGAQRAAIKQELAELNQKVDKLTGLLEGGKLKVRVVNED